MSRLARRSVARMPSLFRFVEDASVAGVHATQPGRWSPSVAAGPTGAAVRSPAGTAAACGSGAPPAQRAVLGRSTRSPGSDRSTRWAPSGSRPTWSCPRAPSDTTSARGAYRPTRRWTLRSELDDLTAGGAVCRAWRGATRRVTITPASPPVKVRCPPDGAAAMRRHRAGMAQVAHGDGNAVEVEPVLLPPVRRRPWSRRPRGWRRPAATERPAGPSLPERQGRTWDSRHGT